MDDFRVQLPQKIPKYQNLANFNANYLKIQKSDIDTVNPSDQVPSIVF